MDVSGNPWTDTNPREGSGPLKNKEFKSREIGLEIGSLCCKYFLKSQHLHYGYWPEDLAVDVANLKAAQDNYDDFLHGHIPDGTKTILDVGCGTGEFIYYLKNAHPTIKCEGLEYLPELCSMANKILGNCVKQGSILHKYNADKEKYDYITLLNTHMIFDD